MWLLMLPRGAAVTVKEGRRSNGATSPRSKGVKGSLAFFTNAAGWRGVSRVVGGRREPLELSLFAHVTLYEGLQTYSTPVGRLTKPKQTLAALVQRSLSSTVVAVSRSSRQCPPLGRAAGLRGAQGRAGPAAGFRTSPRGPSLPRGWPP